MKEDIARVGACILVGAFMISLAISCGSMGIIRAIDRQTSGMYIP